MIKRNFKAEWEKLKKDIEKLDIIAKLKNLYVFLKSINHKRIEREVKKEIRKIEEEFIKQNKPLPVFTEEPKRPIITTVTPALEATVEKEKLVEVEEQQVKQPTLRYQPPKEIQRLGYETLESFYGDIKRLREGLGKGLYTPPGIRMQDIEQRFENLRERTNDRTETFNKLKHMVEEIKDFREEGIQKEEIKYTREKRGEEKYAA